jgi:hypothetical protein
MTPTESVPARWLRIEHAAIFTPRKKALEVLVSGLVTMNRRVRFSVVPELTGHVERLLGGQTDEQRLGTLDESAGRQEVEARSGFDLVMMEVDVGHVAQWPDWLTSQPERIQAWLGRIHRLRLAAWNYTSTAAVCDADDLAMIVKHMRLNGGRMDLAVRLRLAQKALRQTAAFEQAAADCLAAIKTG